MPDDTNKDQQSAPSPFASTVTQEPSATVTQEAPAQALDMPESSPPPALDLSSIKPEEKKPDEEKKNDLPPPQPAPPISAITTKPSGGSKFGFFAVLGVVVGILVWGGVAYLYLTNKDIRVDDTGSTNQNQNGSPTPTPPPAFSPDQIKILNGSIVRDIPQGTQTILVDKKDYKTTGITGFAKVIVSPDDSKMCFEAWPPAPAPALYFSDIEGKSVIKIGENYKNCLWSPDSVNIFYIQSAASDLPVNIYAYDTSRGQEKNITADSQKDGTRGYEIVGLSGDGSKVICKYILNPDTQSPQVGNCELDIQTLTVKDTD